MSVGSETYKNTILDMVLGATHDPAFDDVKWFALFLGDPTEGGLEVDLIGTNYERVEIPNDGDMWDPASGGFKSNLLQITWPVASATWNFVTHWGICDDETGGNVVLYGPLYEHEVSTGYAPYIAPGLIVVEVR